MKNFKLLFSLFISLLISSYCFTQKVENKKSVTYIDDKPFLKIDGGSLMMDNQPAKIISYQSGKLLFVLTKHFYVYHGDKGYWYNELRFADYDLSFKSSYNYKPLIKSLYENGVLNENGALTKESIEKYIKLFGYTPLEDK